MSTKRKSKHSSSSSNKTHVHPLGIFYNGKSSDKKIVNKLKNAPASPFGWKGNNRPNQFILDLPSVELLWKAKILPYLYLKDAFISCAVCKTLHEYCFPIIAEHQIPLRVPEDIKSLQNAVLLISQIKQLRAGPQKANVLDILVSKGCYRIEQKFDEVFKKQRLKPIKKKKSANRKTRPVRHLIVQQEEVNVLRISSSISIGGQGTGSSGTELICGISLSGSDSRMGETPTEVTLQDLAILNSPAEGIEMVFNVKATIKNCRITGSSGHGLYAGNGAKCSLVDVVVEGSQWSGVVAESQQGSKVWLSGEGTRIVSNCQSSEDGLNEYGVKPSGGTLCADYQNPCMYLVYPLRIETVSTNNNGGNNVDEHHLHRWLKKVDAVFSTTEKRNPESSEDEDSSSSSEEEDY